MRRLAYWLTLTLIFTIPFKEIFVLSDVGSVSRILGLLASLVWLGAVLQRGYIRRPSIFHLAAFIFILWNTISILWSVSPDNSVERSFTYLRIGIFIWFIWDLLDNETTVWHAGQAYVLGTWITAGSLFLNFLNNVEAYDSANGRFAATGFNTNETGLLLALGLPLAWYLAVLDPLGRFHINTNKPLSPLGSAMYGLLRCLNYLYVPLALFSILLTASRGSLIAATPVLLLILVTFGRTPLFVRMILIAGIIPIAMSLATLVPQQNLERLGTASEEFAASDLNGRVTVWRDGFEVFENNFIKGVGTGSFRTAIDTNKAPHNVFVALGVDIGLIGLVLFIFVLLIVFSAVWRQSGYERTMWLVLLVTWFLGSMVGNWEYENVTWLFFCLIVKSATLAVSSAVKSDVGTMTMHINQRLDVSHPSGLASLG